MNTPIATFLLARIEEEPHWSDGGDRAELIKENLSELVRTHADCGNGLGRCDDAGQAHDGMEHARDEHGKAKVDVHDNGRVTYVFEADGGGPRCMVLQRLAMCFFDSNQFNEAWTML